MVLPNALYSGSVCPGGDRHDQFTGPETHIRMALLDCESLEIFQFPQEVFGKNRKGLRIGLWDSLIHRIDIHAGNAKVQGKHAVRDPDAALSKLNLDILHSKQLQVGDGSLACREGAWEYEGWVCVASQLIPIQGKDIGP